MLREMAADPILGRVLRDAGIEPAKIKTNENANDSNESYDSSSAAAGGRMRLVNDDRPSPTVMQYSLPASGFQKTEPLAWHRDLTKVAQQGNAERGNNNAMAQALKQAGIDKESFAKQVKDGQEVPNGTSVVARPTPYAGHNHDGRGR
jgi:hypothetical protein